MNDVLRGNSLRISNTQGPENEPHGPAPMSYQERRFDEYPIVFDHLDALWKQLEIERANGRILHVEAEAMLDDITALKRRYPKPEK